MVIEYAKKIGSYSLSLVWLFKTGYYMIGTSVIKELKPLTKSQTQSHVYDRVQLYFLTF